MTSVSLLRGADSLRNHAREMRLALCIELWSDLAREARWWRPEEALSACRQSTGGSVSSDTPVTAGSEAAVVEKRCGPDAIKLLGRNWRSVAAAAKML